MNSMNGQNSFFSGNVNIYLLAPRTSSARRLHGDHLEPEKASTALSLAANLVLPIYAIRLNTSSPVWKLRQNCASSSMLGDTRGVTSLTSRRTVQHPAMVKSVVC